MAGKNRSRPTWPRAAWFASEVPPALSPETRRRLIEANKGFDVPGPWLDDLERIIRNVVLEPQRMDAPVKARRAELVALADAAKALRSAITKLHPRSRAEVLTALVLLGGRADSLRRLPGVLSALRHACAEALGEMPGHGGRPNEARRNQLIAEVCRFVDRLQPSRWRATVRGALSRNAASDRVHVPLTMPQVDLRRRCTESVKAVLAELKLFAPMDLDAIIRKMLTEKPH